MLFAFIQQAQQDSLRNLIIIHGKGREEGSHANIVRSYLGALAGGIRRRRPFMLRCPIMAAAVRAM